MEKEILKRIRMQILVLIASVLLIIVLIFAMTAAWFTNVAASDSLTFKTESWGFETDNITVLQEAIPIRPGASGIVPLSVDNSEGDETINVTVSISKQDMMPAELQKRIYFTPNSYTYRILPGQTLNINETYYNDVPIKWEWVYDMLGYYFRGTVTAGEISDGTEGTVTTPGTAVEEEYLHPIEYDYEKAIFDTDEESETYLQLLQIGSITTADFLIQISDEDDYSGLIDVSEAIKIEDENGINKFYYPIDVDENGYGIWAYLCNQAEVEAGFVYDTGLVESQTPITTTATITFTAYSVPAKTESVSTEKALLTALKDEQIDVVALNGNVETESLISFEEGTKVLDLNGYTLSYAGEESAYKLITVSDNATLVVTNGLISGDASAAGFSSKMDAVAFEVTDGNVVLNNVNVSGVDSAVIIADYMAEAIEDSVVQIINCDLTAEQVAVFAQGNGAASEALTKIFIQNSKITSKYNSAISGQGNDERYGTELVVADSEVTGYYGGIYQPQRQSVTTITNSVITGNTGIILKGGAMNIYDSTITGTGQVATDPAAIMKSGYTDTGDGIYVEAAYTWSCTLTVNGKAQVISEKAYAVEMIGENGLGPGKIMIFDGTYTGAKGSAHWNNTGIFEIYGGVFNNVVNETITVYTANDEAE